MFNADEIKKRNQERMLKKQPRKKNEGSSHRRGRKKRDMDE